MVSTLIYEIFIAVFNTSVLRHLLSKVVHAACNLEEYEHAIGLFKLLVSATS